MTRASTGAVELRDLIGAPGLDGLEVLHLAAERGPVRDLALVTDFEDIGAVGPDTVVLLSAAGARGGWMVSAALRYAWERRACALIVPEQPFTASVVDLARRLEVSLLTTRGDMTRLAIDAAIRLGTARAESAARVRSSAERLAGAADPAHAIALLSSELDDARVWVESAGTRTFSAGPEAHALAAAEPGIRVSVALFPHGSGAFGGRGGSDGRPAGTSERLIAEVAPAATAFAEQLLADAAPVVRALLLEQRLEATRASLPVIAVTALTGSAPVAAFDPPDPSLVDAAGFPLLEGEYLAVCLVSEEPERLGALVHQLWFLAFPDLPLARFDGGWFGFLPAADRDRLADALRRIERGFIRAAGLPIAGGSSRVHRSRSDTRIAVHEAWLAARVADRGDDARARSGAARPFLAFERIPARLLARFVPGDLAARLVELLFPRLVADSNRDQLIDAVLAVLACRGSVQAAATRLGLHRNTVQARLQRAVELGIDLSDPELVLPVHLLLSAARRTAGAPEHSGAFEAPA